MTPRRADAPLSIETPAFTAKVVGTVLRVVVHEGGRATLAVGHGAVEVTPRGGAPVMVRSGGRWPADSVDAPSAEELSRLGAADLEGVTAASFAPGVNGNVSVNGNVGVSGNASVNGNACRGSAEERLACELARADSGDALAAESALYQAGWIALREQGRPDRALALWDRERGRFPHGVLAREAQTSIVDALLELGRTRRARAEIADYLRTDPDGLRAGELHYVLATLYRDADGTCHRARPELDLALRRPAAPWAARARTLRDRCARLSVRHSD